MKRINKKLQTKFVTEAKTKILAIGAKLLPVRFQNQTYWEFELDGENPFTLTLYPVGHHDTCFTVFGRFQNPIQNLTGPSGKFNLHQTGELDDVLKYLDYYLNLAKQNLAN